MIKFSEITKFFNSSSRPALDSISTVIKPGVITGLVGPDGAGKTTLVRLIAGLLKPTSGSIDVFGFNPVREPSKIRSFLGYMPQRFGLYEDLTVYENLALYAKLRNLPRKSRKERFEKILSFTGLEKFHKRLARNLSGGMKQKLGLACAFITTPRLLVLDEPSVGVDPVSRRELWQMTREFSTPDSIVVWCTSYLDEAELCDETLLLDRGRLLFAGKPKDLSKRATGRTVKVYGLDPSEKRGAIAQLSQHEAIVDATIQGSALRFTIKPNESIKEIIDRRFTNCRFEITPSTFEDGFIDLLLQSDNYGKAKTELETDESILSKAKGRPHYPHILPKKTDEVVIEARKMTKRFGSFTAASEIDFFVKRGEIFGLLGPNGAGKSTTFRMLCGLLTPSSGEGFVGGVSLSKSSSEARKHLGYMAQKFSLYANLTVEQNLVFYGGAYGLDSKRRKTNVKRALLEYDLQKYRSVPAGELPLGYKQRLALATATLHSPEALFLDEPTSGVDPLTRREFWRIINQFAQQGIAVLVTTHFMDEAEYCDSIALILDGKKIAQGEPEELKNLARNRENPDPSLEEAFIELIKRGRDVRAKN